MQKENFRHAALLLTLAVFLTGCAIFSKPSAEIPAPAATARPADLLIRIRMLKGDPAARTLVGEAAGKQHGREAGPSIRLTAREGKIQPHPGRFRFTVELRDFTYERMRGGTIRLSRVVDGELQLRAVPIPKDFGLPDSQGRPQHRFEVEVLNGDGLMEIHNDWANADSVLAVRAPDEVGRLFRPYPPYRVLSTCTRQLVASHQCGKYRDTSVGELLNLVRHDEDRVTTVLFITHVEK